MRVWVRNYQIIFPASDIVAGKLWQLGKLWLRWPHLLRMCRCLFVSTCFFLLFSINPCFYLQSQAGFLGLDASAANANIISDPLAFITLHSSPSNTDGKKGRKIRLTPKDKASFHLQLWRYCNLQALYQIEYVCLPFAPVLIKTTFLYPLTYKVLAMSAIR